MNLLTPLALLGLLMASASALAQDEPQSTPDQAWVDDCPPDMLCAMGADETDPKQGDANATDGRVYKDQNATFGDCGGEVCAYGGNETHPCIECSGPAPDQGTCMDGADANETCRDDVLYFGPGSEPYENAPVDDGFTGREDCEFCRGEDAPATGDDAVQARGNDAAGLGALAVLGAAVAVLVFARRL